MPASAQPKVSRKYCSKLPDRGWRGPALAPAFPAVRVPSRIIPPGIASPATPSSDPRQPKSCLRWHARWPDHLRGAASRLPMTETLLEALSLLGDFDHRRLAGGGRLSRARCSGRGAQCPDGAAVGGGRRTRQSRAFAQRPDRRLRPAVLAGGVGLFARGTTLAHCTIADSAPRSAGRHDPREETLVVAVGTGQALDIGRRGDAEVLFVHDRAADG